MARFQTALLAVALFGIFAVSCAAAESQPRKLLWAWPTVRVTTPVGKINVKPYSWTAPNFVGANWLFPNWWVSGFPEATGARKLLWAWPTVRVTTPVGKINVKPYSWTAPNFVGANWLFPNWWVSGFPEATGAKH